MSDRGERLTALLPDEGVDLMLVSALVDVRYLAGFTGTSGLAVIGADTRTFVTDFRYVEQAAEEVDRSFERVEAPRELFDELGAVLPEGELRLGFEDSDISVHDHVRLRELLPDRVALVPVNGLVERLRAVKDLDEIEHMRAATELADAALAEVLEQGLVGRVEREVALALEVQMRERGASRPSFDSIVAAGPHGALPHASPRDVEILPGQLVVIDWGAQLDGYCSDCTRTLAAGEPGAEAREVYAVVLEAQLAGLRALRAGAGGREVDAAARAVIEAAGYGEHFGHGLGHGVGLEIHEAPRLSRRAEGDLEAGNAVTIEPGVYLGGRFGVRIEDLAIVTEDGCRILTSLPKDLIVCA